MIAKSDVDTSNIEPFPPTKGQPTEPDIQQNATKLSEAIENGTLGPIITPRHIEEADKIVTAPILGANSVVVIVNDNIVQMVRQNSELMKHTLVRDARDAQLRANVPALDGESADAPLFIYRARPTYFQFDYRNHDVPITVSMQGLLRKIEATLENADLEPFGKERGVETMKRNIENLAEGEGYRVRNRSRNKLGSIQKAKKGTLLTLNRYALLKLLKERHCIYATGIHERLGQLNFVEIGRSFFGPESDVEVRGWEAEQILNELWFQGKSNRFQGLQRRHFAILRKKQSRLRRDEKILAILHAANVDVSHRLKKKEMFRKLKAALRNPHDLTVEVISILEAAKKMNVGFDSGRLKMSEFNFLESSSGEISDMEYESDSEAEEDFSDEMGDDQVNAETSDASSVSSFSNSRVKGQRRRRDR
jgi:hypothetical protein